MRIEQGRTTTIIADAASSTTLLCLTPLSFSQAVGTTTQPLIPYFCILHLPHDKKRHLQQNRAVCAKASTKKQKTRGTTSGRRRSLHKAEALDWAQQNSTNPPNRKRSDPTVVPIPERKNHGLTKRPTPSNVPLHIPQIYTNLEAPSSQKTFTFPRLHFEACIQHVFRTVSTQSSLVGYLQPHMMSIYHDHNQLITRRTEVPPTSPPPTFNHCNGMNNRGYFSLPEHAPKHAHICMV